MTESQQEYAVAFYECRVFNSKQILVVVSQAFFAFVLCAAVRDAKPYGVTAEKHAVAFCVEFALHTDSGYPKNFFLAFLNTRKGKKQLVREIVGT